MTGSSMQSRRIHSLRRGALLTTAIAVIGGAALVLAPHMPASNGSAQAQNLTEKVQQLPQRPVGFADIVEKVKPSVISVRVKIDRPVESGLSDDDLPFPPGSPFERFFKRFGAPNGGGQPGGHQVITGQGSGFFITSDGWILTNAHVAHGNQTVRVILASGKAVEGRVDRVHEARDVALIKVEGANFVALPLREKPVTLTEEVYAIGTPLEKKLSGTITKGIVSQIRTNSHHLTDIQADVNIQPGSSGGPLVDAQGNVVGISYAGLARKGGDNIGLNFFIPIQDALAKLNVATGGV